MNDEEVVSYLRQHPDFLAAHSDLLSEITVPHPHSGQAISLAERQLPALREKIRLLENKLTELIRFGEENDETSAKVHRLCLSLIEAEDYNGLRHMLFQSLTNDFGVPYTAFRVWSGVLSREHADFETVSEEVKLFTMQMPKPYCGTPLNQEVMTWFGDDASRIRSVALIPLRRSDQVLGLFVMGSEDEHRFYTDMGTLYLSRIGDLLSSVLRSHLG